MHTKSEAIRPRERQRAERTDVHRERRGPTSNDWKEAIVDRCVSMNIAWDENDARGTLDNLIQNAVYIALDPHHSMAARELVIRGRCETLYEELKSELAEQTRRESLPDYDPDTKLSRGLRLRIKLLRTRIAYEENRRF